jgi:hypothetical protein
LPDINTIGLQSQTRYNVAKVLHEKLALKYSLLNESTPYCKYNPSEVLENNLTQYWDRGILTDKSVLHKDSDILFEKSNNIVYVIDVSIPNLGNSQTAFSTKMGKYAEASTEMKQWLLEATYTLPVTISATGDIPHTLHDVLKLLDLLALLHMTIQKYL